MQKLNVKAFFWIFGIPTALAWFGIATFQGFNLSNIFGFIKPLPIVITIDLTIWFLFSKWLWRWRRLQGWLVPYPDLNGTWFGNIQTDWKDENGNTPGPIPTMLTIKQSFSHVSCVMRTSEMVSNSFAEGFCIDQDRQISQLCYTYTSKPKSKLRERSTPHDGTILFDIKGKPASKLEGEYWTQRKTTGSIVLELKDKKHLDEFPPDFPVNPMNEQK